MATPRPGKPNRKALREYRIAIRLTRQEHDVVVANAADSHRTLSDYARLCVLADPPVVATR